jgi:hypothetical protein
MPVSCGNPLQQLIQLVSSLPDRFYYDAARFFPHIHDLIQIKVYGPQQARRDNNLSTRRRT